MRTTPAMDTLDKELLKLAYSVDYRTPCADKTDRHLWTSDQAEERAEAAQLCSPCVVLDLCQAAGQSQKHRDRFGVWGGIDITPPKVGGLE